MQTVAPVDDFQLRPSVWVRQQIAVYDYVSVKESNQTCGGVGDGRVEGLDRVARETFREQIEPISKSAGKTKPYRMMAARLAPDQKASRFCALAFERFVRFLSMLALQVNNEV